MSKRIKIWDELRGVAILFMIFVHFFYYQSTAATFYHLNPTQIFSHVSGLSVFFKGVINLHTSYLAPFLFLFIVGVISHFKFSRQKGPDLRAACKRFLKLFSASMVLRLFFYFHADNPITIEYGFKLPIKVLNSGGILMTIAYVYLINEFILHSVLKYFNRPYSSKIISIIIFGMLIIFFNINTKTIFPTYHTLPTVFIVLSGLFTSLLGDLFLSINNIIERKNLKLLSLFYIIIPAMICIVCLIIIRPSMGSIKEMNIIYFIYCFSLSAVMIEILNHEMKFIIFDQTKMILALIGRHSLGLYVFHFIIGRTFEKYILFKHVPQNYWPVNIMVVFLSCLLMAKFLEKIQKDRPLFIKNIQLISNKVFVK